MDIYPEPITTNISYDKDMMEIELDYSIHEETHCYAILCQLKQ